jgi:hypothetical protein
MTNPATTAMSSLKTLEAMVTKTCFCKLREICEDKTSPECLKHTNLYAEAMLARQAEK